MNCNIQTDIHCIYILFVIFKSYGSLNYFFPINYLFREIKKPELLFEKGILQICSKFMGGTPIQKCDFNQVAHVCRTPLKKTSGDCL